MRKASTFLPFLFALAVTGARADLITNGSFENTNGTSLPQHGGGVIQKSALPIAQRALPSPVPLPEIARRCTLDVPSGTSVPPWLAVSPIR